MRYLGLAWVSCLTTVFLFLPSLAMKLWGFLNGAPWSQKSWLVYTLLVIILLNVIRIRRRLRKRRPDSDSLDSLVFLAKQRLVKGELSIEEFRQIREELKQS